MFFLREMIEKFLLLRKASFTTRMPNSDIITKAYPGRNSLQKMTER